MGTPSMTLVIKNGATKVAQYYTHDGYPTGVGLWNLQFLRNVDQEAFAERVAELEKVSYHTAQLRRETKRAEYPHLDNLVPNEVLWGIARGDFREVEDSSNLLDRVAYRYTINLDRGTFVVEAHGFTLGHWPLDKLPSEEFFLRVCKKNF